MNKHAYLIMAHGEPEMLDVLLQLLDDERNDIFLHIDRKALSMRQHYAHVELHRAGFHLLQQPIAVYWGHTSQVEAELLLMRTALQHGPYAYYHLLSGNDMPVKTQDEIHNFFRENEGREFVGFWQSEDHQRDALRKTRYYYFLNRYKKRSAGLKHLLSSPVRNLLLALQKGLGVNRRKGSDVEVKKGFNWFSITEDCCRFVVSQEQRIWDVFHHTLCPDEMFLHTIVWNSPFRTRLFDTQDAQRGSMRAIDWERGNPYVWQKKDTDYLLHSPYLFARKFSAATLSESLLSALRPR